MSELHAYATELTRSLDTAVERDDAASRLLDHHLHTACAVHSVLFPYRERITVQPPRPGAVAEEVASRGQALAWISAERPPTFQVEVVSLRRLRRFRLVDDV